MDVRDAVLLRLFSKKTFHISYSYMEEEFRLRCLWILWTVEPMTIQDFIMESIPYGFKIRGILW